MKKILLIFAVLLIFSMCGCTSDRSEFSIGPFTAFADVTSRDCEYQGVLEYTDYGSLIFEVASPKELQGFTFVVDNDGARASFDGALTDFSDESYKSVLSEILECLMSVKDTQLETDDNSLSVSVGEYTFVADVTDKRISEIRSKNFSCTLSY